MKTDQYNGHIVVHDIPGPRITSVWGGHDIDEDMVKIMIDYAGGPSGKAYLCMSTHCCKYLGRYLNKHDDNLWDKSKYDVLLTDATYPVYFPDRDDNTGLVDVVKSKFVLSTDEVVMTLEQTKKSYAQRPIKPKGSFLRKPELADRMLACPSDMINPFSMPDLRGSWE